MDNIKYKEAGSGYFIKIDDKGNKSASFSANQNPKNSGFGYYKEMMAWVDAGGVIEPQITTEELAQKEIDDLKKAIENQKIICIKLLRDSDYKLHDDFEYPEDLPKIKLDRLEWKRIIKSDKIETIP